VGNRKGRAGGEKGGLWVKWVKNSEPKRGSGKKSNGHRLPALQVTAHRRTCTWGPRKGKSTVKKRTPPKRKGGGYEGGRG